LAIAHNTFSELVGKDWSLTEVRLFRDPPADVEPFRRHFRARLRFAAEHAAIVFPATDLARPLAASDAGAYVKALRELETMEDSSDARQLGNKVRRLLHGLFITEFGLGRIDLQAIAQLFALHPRTLNRRLRAEGTKFNALLAETRYEIARQLLRDTNLRVADIANILGYADSASFNHAFRRWSGATATRWRSSNTSN
jgi:AraC-like DNA-binding protein